MRQFGILLVVCSALVIRAPVNAEEPTIIHAGTLLAMPGEAPRRQQSVVINDGKVVEIRDGYIEADAGSTFIDLRDNFVLPGLMDMHVHFTLAQAWPRTLLQPMKTLSMTYPRWSTLPSS